MRALLNRNQATTSMWPILCQRRWKVVHVPDLDFGASCYTPTQCLAPLAAWSAANPSHDPLFVVIEMKVGACLAALCLALSAHSAVKEGVADQSFVSCTCLSAKPEHDSIVLHITCSLHIIMLDVALQPWILTPAHLMHRPVQSLL